MGLEYGRRLAKQTRIYLENPKWTLDMQLYKGWAEIGEGDQSDFPDDCWKNILEWISEYTARERQFPSVTKLLRLKNDLLFICGGIVFVIDQIRPSDF